MECPYNVLNYPVQSGFDEADDYSGYDEIDELLDSLRRASEVRTNCRELAEMLTELSLICLSLLTNRTSRRIGRTGSTKDSSISNRLFYE